MNQSPRVNERITAPRVVLITADGQNRGEVAKFVALDQARKDGLDLVEVSSGRVPVCKIIDYGKMLYQKSKAQKHQTAAPAMKEIRVKYATGDHDLQRQIGKAKEFLAEGHKVLFFMGVRGRERFVSKGIAKEKFISIVNSLSPSVKPNDIQENDKGYSIVVHPVANS